MKKIVLIVCALLMSAYSFAQDTLTVVPDTTKVEELKTVEEMPPVTPIENEVQRKTLSDSIALVDKYIEKFQYKNALQLLETLPPTRALLEKKANCFASLYELPPAIEILEKLSAQNPKDASLKLKLVSIYEQTQWYPKTIACYNELIELDPTNDYYKLLRANYLYSRENIRAALEQYQELCDSCDNNFLVRRLASCYEKINELKTAKHLFARAWDLDTLDGFSAASLVKLLIKDKQYELAIFASNRYMAIDSTYTSMNAMNAFAYYCYEQYNEAARRFQKCVENGDSSLLVMRTLGLSHFIMERDSLANEPLQLAYKQDTTNLKVLYPLAQTYSFLGDYPNAIKHYAELMKQRLPTEDELYSYYRKWGEAYYDNGEYDLAVGKLHMSLRHVIEYSDKVELLKKMAYCYEHHLKNTPLAISYYKQYRAGLLSQEISLGGVDEDLSTLNLTDAQVNQITKVRKEIAALDEHLVALQNSIPDNVLIIGGQQVKFEGQIPDALRQQVDSLNSQKEKRDSLATQKKQSPTDTITSPVKIE